METTFSNLKKRIDTTANNRFNASERVKRHHNFSLATVIFFSLGLILVSITQALNIDVGVSEVSLNASSIFFSVAILTISTALSMSNFGLRSEKYHDCGRELSAISINLEKAVSNAAMHNSDEYEKYQQKYESVLSKYENHKQVDHLFTKLSWTEQYEPKWYRWPSAYLRLWAEYSAYFLLIAIEILWLLQIFTPIFKCAALSLP